MFAGAGLPSAVSAVLNDDVLTFLRRADHRSLGRVSLDEVSIAIQKPIERTGRKISDGLARRVAEATSGYPFLIQLVGYHIWRQQPRHKVVSADDVDVGVVAARRRLGSLVHEPAISDLSGVARTFLLAMAHDDGPSRMGDIAARLDVDGNYASQYRLRLIATELIEPAGHRRVDYSMRYLREHAALDAQRELPRGDEGDLRAPRAPARGTSGRGQDHDRPSARVEHRPSGPSCGGGGVRSRRGCGVGELRRTRLARRVAGRPGGACRGQAGC